MTRTSYKMSNGLAFAELKDMKTLRKKALKGWHLKRFRCLGYEFEKGEPEDVIFSIDYRKLNPEEKEEYFEMFKVAGWVHVCTESTMHIFKAKKGTHPIYSDTESSRDKLNRLGNSVTKATAFCVGLTIISLFIMTYTSGIIQDIGHWTYLASFILTTPAVMTYIAIHYHKFNLRRKGLKSS